MTEDDFDPDQLDLLHDFVWGDEEEDDFFEADWDWDVEDDE